MGVINFMFRTAVRAQWRFPAVVMLVAAASLICERATACDVCAIYTATEMRESRVGPSLGIAEQFSRFTTLQERGEEVDNPANERLESSITQLLVGYTFTPRLGVQLSLPVISRSFRRQEESGVVRGDERGIGDLSVIGQVAALSHVDEESVSRFSLFGGVKFPTGDSDRLREELSEMEMGSGIHGHDLALGSGSYDGVVGGRFFGSWRRAFLTGVLQYTIRTEGDFHYDYANDLTWAAGPGAFVWLDNGFTLGLQAVLSGETKGKDTLDGVAADDTAITTLYAGPGALLTWGSSLGAELAADLPVIQNNSALQIVPNFRLRSGLVWRF